MSNPKELFLDGQRYVPADAEPGTRAVVVVDRGWIFAGDVDESIPGRIVLRRCVWVFSWSGIGFAKMIEDPKCGKCDIRKHADISIPSASELFRVPVGDSWGL